MTAITFAGPGVGSFDWKIPEDTSSYLEGLPEDLRQHFLEKMEMHIMATLTTLTGTVFLGPVFDIAMEILNESASEATTILCEIAKEMPEA